MTAKVLVLTGEGLNCERETGAVFSMAGFKSEILLVSRLIRNPQELHNSQVLVIPGGFSYGDSTGAGNALGCLIKYTLAEELQKFLKAGNVVIGICNGCQVLVSLRTIFPADVALAQNSSKNYECRWIYAHATRDSPWFERGEILRIPVAHGEGRFVGSERSLQEGAVLQYCNADGTPAAGNYPLNPNGSAFDVAAITNSEGNALGIMPHPERGALGSQHPDFANNIYNARLRGETANAGFIDNGDFFKHLYRRLA